VRAVERTIAGGTDLVKLFTGSYVQRGVVRPMPLPIARAAVDAAHAHHQLVFAHPSNFEGSRVALESGVDVLAHAPDAPQGIDDHFLRRVVASRMAMVPTLKMFGTTVSSDRGYLQPIYKVVQRFHELGGELLFGTDVGYMTDYSTEGEITALAECGLDWRVMFRMLTEAPARRFSANERGVIAPGKRADLVILDSDPSRDVRAFARVWSTVRAGQILWSRS
jgi:imidazolonepropionase-like amidohydrolase